jgi:hypothetical protein
MAEKRLKQETSTEVLFNVRFEVIEETTMESIDITEEKREQLKKLFPEVFGGDKIDVQQLVPRR